MDDRVFAINLIWDSKEAKWIAKSEDVPGLVLEAGSLDALINGLKDAVPELAKILIKNFFCICPAPFCIKIAKFICRKRNSPRIK